MKKPYLDPEMDVLELLIEDVIVTSVDEEYFCEDMTDWDE